jgi:hypothetical protein
MVGESAYAGDEKKRQAVCENDTKKHKAIFEFCPGRFLIILILL